MIELEKNTEERKKLYEGQMRIARDMVEIIYFKKLNLSMRNQVKKKYIYQTIIYISDEKKLTRILTGHHTGYFIIPLTSMKRNIKMKLG
jgi:hypothetical protein